jgi:hypothetical protein
MLRATGNALLQKTSQAKRKITKVRGTVLKTDTIISGTEI